MLYRKIAKKIEEHLLSNTKEILLVDGARQVGKTYIIRYVGKKLFKNFIEINFLDDLSMDLDILPMDKACGILALIKRRKSISKPSPL